MELKCSSVPCDSTKFIKTEIFTQDKIVNSLNHDVEILDQYDVKKIELTCYECDNIVKKGSC